MQNSLIRNFLNVTFLIFALTFLYFSYSNNGLLAANNYWYKTFEASSEQLVLDGILNGGDRPTLGRFSRPTIDQQTLEAHKLFEDANKEGKFKGYTSQYGFQVQMFNHLRNMGFENVNHLKSLTAFLMAVVVLGLTITIWRDFSARSALVFYIVFLISPWVISFSSNLYWISFSWFIPLLLTSIFSPKIYKNIRFYYFLLALLFLSFLFKFLSGYEYITTIVLASITPIVYHGLKLKKAYRFILVLCSGVFIISLISFVASILIHAKSLDLIHAKSLDSSSVSGLQIIENIAKNRMLSIDNIDKSLVEMCGIDQGCLAKNEAIHPSLELNSIKLESNSIKTTVKYFFNGKFLPWTSIMSFNEQEKELIKLARDEIKNNLSFDLIFNLEMSLLAKLALYLSGILLSTIFFITLILMCFSLWRTAPIYLLIPLLITFIAPLSWFFLAKGHSYHHYHLNYVLWYLYFIPFSAVVLSEVKWKK